MTEIVRRISLACLYASCVPLFLMIAISASDVFARYALKTAVPDTVELSGMLLALSISLALAYTTFSGDQVRFTLLLQYLPPRGRAVLDVASLAVSATLFVVIAWQAFGRVGGSIESGEYIGSLEVPLWPAKAVFAFCCALTALALIVSLMITLRRPAAPRSEAGEA